MSVLWGLFEFSTTLFEFLLLEYLASKQLVKNKARSNKSKFFALMIMATVMYIMTILHAENEIKIIVSLPLFIAYIFTFYQGNIVRKFLVVGGGYIAMFVPDYVIPIIFSVVLGENFFAIASTQNLNRFIFIIVAKVIHFFIIFLMSKFKKLDTTFFKFRSLMVVLTIIMLSTMITMLGLYRLIYEQTDMQSVSVLALSISSIIASCVFSCVMFLSFSDSSKKLALSYVKTQRLEDGMTAIEQQKVSDDRMRAMHHEYKNKFMAMGLYWNSNQQDLLGTTINEEIRRFGMVDFKFCGDSVADNAINIRRWQASSKGIRFTVKGDFEDGLAITGDELCSVLGNLLDNAIEATSAIENPDNKWIEIETKRNSEKMYITVSNYCEKKFKKNTTRIPTTKKDADMHGFGLMIIREIVDKYNGDFGFEVINNVFTAKISLDGYKQN